MPETPVERLNSLTGSVQEMGIVILAASPDEVTCEWEVVRSTINRMGPCTAACCGVIETSTSIGAAPSTWSDWRTAPRSSAPCALEEKPMRVTADPATPPSWWRIRPR